MSNYLYPYLFLFLMLRGESSLSKENKTILEWVKENPGRTTREIAEGVGMDGREVAKRVLGMNRMVSL